MAPKPTYDMLEQRIRELEKTAAALQESEERYRRLTDNSPDMIYHFSLPLGRFEYVSPACSEIFGLSPEAFLKRPETLGDCVHPDARAVFDHRWRSLCQGKARPPVEYKILRAGEGERWIRQRDLVVENGNGSRAAIEGVISDITDRKQGETALRESEKRLTFVLEGSQLGFWDWDIQTGDVFRNHRWAEMLGYTLEEIQFTVTQWSDLHHPDDREAAWQSIQDHLEGRTPFHKVEYRMRAKDGQYKWILDQAKVVSRDADGRPLRMSGTHTDITERKKTEESLRQSENRLQRIFEIVPIGLWFADKDGTLLRGNPAGVRIWGAEPKVPITDYGIFKAWRLPSGEPVAPDDWALARTIRDKVTIVDELLEIEAFDGKRKTILNYTAPILDADGTVDGAIVVNLDISERKSLEAKLHQSQKMESIGRLAGGVAHDFNNMLGVILGHTEMALEYVDPSRPLYDDLGEIRLAASRSADLTRQLLAFARKQAIAPRVLDLNKTLEGMLKMLKRMIGEDIELVWAPGKKLWPVRMDPSQIDQILANLCVNAREAITGVGKVTIETANVTLDEAYCAVHDGFAPGAFVQLVVSDNGCGMDPETLGHIYEPFFTTKASSRGTGLGLATIYGIVKQNNGFINVYSEPDQGTSFKIYLPRHFAQMEQLIEGGLLQPMAQGHETVLLVEDEPAILKMTSKMLDRLGYQVLAASTPAAAIDIARAHPGDIHLLMTDVVMPVMNGRDLAKTVLSFHPVMKRLFMSGYTANVIAHHGVLDEGVHFIQKPFTKQDLSLKLRQVLDEDRVGPSR